eukprot:TRINITY_DN20058_c0_g2_i6.p1 TRINITY_DN20058_c0_g2~~TRINITY_DN20058_c0_g2_i6.p1  ORF type:complete len:337 (-),score=69.07 TRINITY_DN20058_c0_g2_i6:71-1081(-)
MPPQEPEPTASEPPKPEPPNPNPPPPEHNAASPTEAPTETPMEAPTETPTETASEAEHPKEAPPEAPTESPTETTTEAPTEAEESSLVPPSPQPPSTRPSSSQAAPIRASPRTASAHSPKGDSTQPLIHVPVHPIPGMFDPSVQPKIKRPPRPGRAAASPSRTVEAAASIYMHTAKSPRTVLRETRRARPIFPSRSTYTSGRNVELSAQSTAEKKAKQSAVLRKQRLDAAEAEELSGTQAKVQEKVQEALSKPTPPKIQPPRTPPVKTSPATEAALVNQDDEEEAKRAQQKEAKILHSALRKVQAACSKEHSTCLLYTSDAADEEDSVDLGGRRII